MAEGFSFVGLIADKGATVAEESAEVSTDTYADGVCEEVSCVLVPSTALTVDGVDGVDGVEGIDGVEGVFEDSCLWRDMYRPLRRSRRGRVILRKHCHKGTIINAVGSQYDDRLPKL